MRLMKEFLLTNDYVLNKEKQGVIFHLKLCESAVITHLGILPYPGHRIILETIKKVHKENKSCIYSYPVSTAADEMGFMYILPITVITK